MTSTRTPRQLDPVEIRVLGVLLEKEQTTPEACPLTVNAVLAGANQKTNRDPVMELTEEQVVDALDRLRQVVLAWRTEGARTERWQQSVVRRWGLDRAGKALMTLLLLRGAQTPGELRSRSDRLHPFASVEEVEAALQGMAGMDEPLVRELPRRPGQKESRWIHLVGEVAEPAPEPAYTAGAAGLPAERPDRPSLAARVERLESTVAQLADELKALKDLLS
ncbi:MAG TPA: YceH family protein [Thermoanaerobaculia bacterium]|nr:YceH family protein [Thermoanaerobaculia bacterium]